MHSEKEMATMRLTSRPAEPERHDPKVGESQPCASTWDWENAYTGPPEDGQPRMGSAPPRSVAAIGRDGRAAPKDLPH
jgi:hypothetical protein